MIPDQPLSVKFPQPLRTRLKKLSFMIDCPESELVRASVTFFISFIEEVEPLEPPPIILAARKALQADRSTISNQPSR